MGAILSRREPWRKTKTLTWNEEYCTELINEINTFGEEPLTRRGKITHGEEPFTRRGKANCLLLGPVGVGKSTFINSLLSISKGRYSDISYTADKTWGSVTKQYFSYEMNDKLKYVRLWDTSGIMEAGKSVFKVENIDDMIKGHVKSGYDLYPEKNRDTKEDQIHCATFVMDARLEYDDLDEKFLRKIRTLQQRLLEEDVPRVLILTKCDILCPELKRRPHNIYKSTYVEKAVDKASEVFHIPKSNIYPVINYGQGQIDLDPETSIPLLLALRQMSNSAKDHREKMQT